MLLVGLDAASQLKNFGYAIGRLKAGRITIDEAGMLETKQDPDALRDRIAVPVGSADHALLAIDAPLGWPRALGSALPDHRAGDWIRAEKSSLFSRETDRVVTAMFGKRPLEVGADKIARAAHGALEVLNRLRKLTDSAIPLAWSHEVDGISAIEVYPAATLKARGLDDAGYKKSDNKAKLIREHIADGLHEEIPDLARFVEHRADIFDACLCLVAAKDFLECNTLNPEDGELARQEGWIWVRRDMQQPSAGPNRGKEK